ncbi:hypothetical protein HRbin36_00817 [bacterium HR36]|nr:hypothetical protein HRbin36_00817 [bacterium HR36]
MDRQTTIAANQSVEHHGITVNNAKTLRPRAYRQQLLARDNQGDTRLANHAHLAYADGREDRDILRAQAPPRLQQQAAGWHVFPTTTHAFSRRYRFQDLD